MEKERKIKCDCGTFFERRSTDFNGIRTNAMVCPSCNFTTFTKKQAEEYISLKRLHEIVDSEKKVIKIGNSIGITLPEKLKEFGVKLGRKIKIKALSENSIKIEF